MFSTWLLSHTDLILEGVEGFLAGTDFQVTRAHGNDKGDAAATPPKLIICGMDRHSSSDIVQEVVRLQNCFPTSRLVMLASVEVIRVIPDIFHCGVDGYLLKDMSREVVLSYLHLTMMGERVLPPQLAMLREESGAGTAGKKETGEHALSGREKEIVQCLMQGESNKLIARNLEITESTVKGHLKVILRKLNVKNRTQAAMLAAQQANDNMSPGEAMPAAA